MSLAYKQAPLHSSRKIIAAAEDIEAKIHFTDGRFPINTGNLNKS
jgi:hypothetical protein